jgi:poly-gamma-glutamate capsule biosynthesis protein CapA/YwtB (metallophosphatase superfamily)
MTIPKPPERAKAAAAPACRKFTVAAVGDIMLGTDFPKDTLPVDDGRGLLAEVAPMLRVADIAFGNLEGVLMDGGEPVKKCQDPKVCFLFRSPARYAQTLKDAGFDVLSLANNHARDFGEAGRSSSMAALDAAGIRHSGRVGDVALWEQDGRRIALIAFSFTTGSNPLNDTEAARALVAELAAQNDIVIVSFHGGAEGGDATRLPFTMETFFGEERGNVVEFARATVDAGADLVLGHGPHVARAMEVYRGRLIAYSLGNFATYFGISVEGLKGYAPLLQATIDGDGQLLDGQLTSGIQRRPDGVKLDPQQRAYRLVRDMTELDLSGGALLFDENGGFRPAQAPGGACAAAGSL